MAYLDKDMVEGIVKAILQGRQLWTLKLAIEIRWPASGPDVPHSDRGLLARIQACDSRNSGWRDGAHHLRVPTPSRIHRGSVTDIALAIISGGLLTVMLTASKPP